MFVSIRFALERYCTIGPHPIALPHKMIDKLCHINNKERQEEPFALLIEVNGFMAHNIVVEPHVAAKDEDSKKRNSAKWMRRKPSGAKDDRKFHLHSVCFFCYVVKVCVSRAEKQAIGCGNGLTCPPHKTRIRHLAKALTTPLFCTSAKIMHFLETYTRNCRQNYKITVSLTRV